MTEITKNSKLANQVYLVVNVLNTGFMVYIIARSFNVMNLLRLENSAYMGIVLGFILVLNLLRNYAKKNGGIGNPMRSNKKARAFHLASVVFFIGGLILVSFLNADKIFIALALLGVPLDMYAIYLAHSQAEITTETDIIDDFEIDEN